MTKSINTRLQFQKDNEGKICPSKLEQINSVFLEFSFRFIRLIQLNILIFFLVPGISFGSEPFDGDKVTCEMDPLELHFDSQQHGSYNQLNTAIIISCENQNAKEAILEFTISGSRFASLVNQETNEILQASIIPDITMNGKLSFRDTTWHIEDRLRVSMSGISQFIYPFIAVLENNNNQKSGLFFGKLNISYRYDQEF